MRKTFIFLTICLLLAGTLGCQSTGTPDAATEAPATSTGPTATEAVHLPPTKYSLGSVTVSQSGTGPAYTVRTETPVMNGSDDPHVVAFNKLVSQAVQKEIEAFKKNLPDAKATQIAQGSSFDLTYMPVVQTDKIVSLQLKIDVYIDGAAHPYDYTVPINYDLAQGKEIALEQLFLPGANYLQALSDYCKTELNKTDLAPDLFAEGFSPKPENFHSWNISEQGLAISFDPYQVAPYAAGPQLVVIPYAALKDVLDPNGPLAEFLK